jgi:ATP-dependent DNA helicase RecG
VIKERIVKLPNRQEPLKFFNYPYAALEESVTNALYHRDYRLYEPVEITIEPHRISILSYAGPDRSISAEAIRSAQSLRSRRYKNRRLGDFLKELGLTEGRATGIPTIQASLKANGSPAATIETDDDRTFFLIDIPCHPMFKDDQLIPTNTNGGHLDGHLEGHLDGHLEKTYKTIKDNPEATLDNIAQRLNISTRKLRRLVEELKRKGYIQRYGRRNGYWIILK